MKLTRISSPVTYVPYADLKAGTIYKMLYNNTVSYVIGMVVEHSWASNVPSAQRYDKFFVNLEVKECGDVVGQMWKINPDVSNTKFVREDSTFTISND
jgi:hypothetical protein